MSKEVNLTIEKRRYEDGSESKLEWLVRGDGKPLGYVFARNTDVAGYKATMLYGSKRQRSRVVRPEPLPRAVRKRLRSEFVREKYREAHRGAPLYTTAPTADTMARKRKRKAGGFPAYRAGHHCPRGKHKFRSVGTYSVCVKCYSRRVNPTARKVGRA